MDRLELNKFEIFYKFSYVYSQCSDALNTIL